MKNNRNNAQNTTQNNQAITKLKKRPLDEFAEFAIIKDRIETNVKELVNTEVSNAFDKKLKTTAKEMSGVIVESVQKQIMESCHDMIHEHMDKFDVTIPVETLKVIVREVIMSEFPTMKPSETQTANKTKRGTEKRLVVRNNVIPPISISSSMELVSEEYPEEYNESALKYSIDPIVKNIVKLEASKENKQVIYKTYIMNMKSKGKTDKKTQAWLDWALSMPYDKLVAYPITKTATNGKIHEFLYQMRKKLDETVHGMNEAKEELMLEVMKRMMNPESTGKIILLEGAPGIGKTYLSRSISESLGIPFESIALGSCRDSAILNGHDFTYVGSQPGLIARSLKKMGCANGNLYLDELDKIGKTEKSQEVSSTLLSIMDETQNTDFKDNYLTDIQLNLSRIMFTASANNVHDINPILLNRCKVIKLPTPTIEDKIVIVREHFFPMYLKMYDISEKELLYNDVIIRSLIMKTVQEPGVRELKRVTEHIVSRFNMLRKTYLNNIILTKKRKIVEVVPPKNRLTFSYSLPDFKIPLELTESVLDKFMQTGVAKEEIDPSVKRMYM